jgi:hypothetical protein
LETDKEAVEGLIRQYLKQEAQRQVVAGRWEDKALGVAEV